MGLESGALALSIATAIAAGLIGCFAVMRRMALAADAISHVALPGIGVALALRIHPLAGAGAMLFFGTLLIWALESRTRIATETIIGVVFSGALAVGSLMSSGEELIEALFGGPGKLTIGEIVFGLLAAAGVVVFVLKKRSSLILVLVSPEVARTAGVNVARLNLLYLEMFALTVALGLRYLGVLLMGSMIIIPAATAKRLACRLFRHALIRRARCRAVHGARKLRRGPPPSADGTILVRQRRRCMSFCGLLPATGLRPLPPPPRICRHCRVRPGDDRELVLQVPHTSSVASLHAQDRLFLRPGPHPPPAAGRCRADRSRMRSASR